MPDTATPRLITVFEQRCRIFAELVYERRHNATPEVYDSAPQWVAERLIALGCDIDLVESCRQRYIVAQDVTEAINAKSIRLGVVNTGWEVRVSPGLLGWAVANDAVKAELGRLHADDRIAIEDDGTVVWR
jgi:hypothetical protein